MRDYKIEMQRNLGQTNAVKCSDDLMCLHHKKASLVSIFKIEFHESLINSSTVYPGVKTAL